MQDIFNLAEKEAALGVASIRDELARRGKAAVIAVADAHGELLALLRMDGAALPSIQVAIRKCWTAARERAPTGELGKRFQEQGWQMSNSDPLFTGWDGGAPLFHRGQVVGAVAVSGLSQEEDAEMARFGIDRIKRTLGE